MTEISDKTKERIIAYYKKRYGCVRIAKMLKMTLDEVVDILKSSGTTMFKRGPVPGANKEKRETLDVKIIELEAKGFPVKEISAALGTTIGRVYGCFYRYGIHKQKENAVVNEPLDEQKNKTILELHNKGLTTYEIETQTGYSRSNVCLRLNKMGIKPRGSGLSNHPDSARVKARIERNRQICADAEILVSNTKLAAKYNLSTERIKDILSDNGMPVQLLKEARNAAIREDAKTLSRSELIEKYKLAEYTIRKILRVRDEETIN